MACVVCRWEVGSLLYIWFANSVAHLYKCATEYLISVAHEPICATE